MASLADIRNTLVSELSLEGLSEEVQNKIIGQFSENVLKQVTLAVLEKLPEEKREEFGKLSESQDTAKLADFLNANVSNLEELVREEARREVKEFKKFQASLE